MNIGLIDVDGHNGFPNLALMRLSAYHKARGDAVEWWNGFKHYDRVYKSKVFTFTPDHTTIIDADEVITGGTGYRDYRTLPPEVEETAPDYSIYPGFKQAIGFLTRGCIRDCPWCVVPKKEGTLKPAATWEQVKRPDSREILFLDNNVLASDFGLEQIDRMAGEKIWVDFNQGLDARFITPEVARKLSRLHWIKYIRVSCDTSAMIPVVKQAVAYMKEAGIAQSRFWSYVLIQDVEDAYNRVKALRDIGVETFAQPYRDYNGGEPTAKQKDFERWCNGKPIYRTVDWPEYKSGMRGVRASPSFR